jgi:prevent-host-death family protein
VKKQPIYKAKAKTHASPVVREVPPAPQPQHEIGAFEAKTHLSALLDRVARGESFIITKRGKAIAELKPAHSGGQVREIGWAKANAKGFWMSPDFDAPLADLKEYME